MTPVELEQAIIDTAERIENSAGVVDKAYTRWLDDKRAWTIAMAKARDADSGSYNDRTDRALIANEELQKHMDHADAAYKYAKSLAETLGSKLSGLQTVAKSMTAAYGAGGGDGRRTR